MKLEIINSILDKSSRDWIRNVIASSYPSISYSDFHCILTAVINVTMLTHSDRPVYVQARYLYLVLGASVAEHATTVATMMSPLAERELYVTLLALFGHVVTHPMICSRATRLFCAHLLEECRSSVSFGYRKNKL